MWFAIAQEHPDILNDPGPSISCPWSAQYEFSVRVDLKAWCPTPKYRPIYLSTLQILQQRMKAANIQLAPQAQSVILQDERLENSVSEA